MWWWWQVGAAGPARWTDRSHRLLCCTRACRREDPRALACSRLHTGGHLETDKPAAAAAAAAAQQRLPIISRKLDGAVPVQRRHALFGAQVAEQLAQLAVPLALVMSPHGQQQRLRLGRVHAKQVLHGGGRAGT